MLAAAVTYALAAVCVKALDGGIPLAQVVLFRSLFALPVLVVLLMRAGGWVMLRTKNPMGHFWRAIWGLVGMVTVYYGYTKLPLANVTALGFTNWLRSSSQTLGVGPALTLPIFEGGALRAQLRGKSAQADAAIAQYNGTLVDAVHEAADAIAARQSTAKQIVQQQQALAAAQDAMRLVDQRYKAGLSNYLTVLSVQSSVLKLQQAGADLKAQALSDDVALIRALGGGYEARALPASAPAQSS